VHPRNKRTAEQGDRTTALNTGGMEVGNGAFACKTACRVWRPRSSRLACSGHLFKSRNQQKLTGMLAPFSLPVRPSGRFSSQSQSPGEPLEMEYPGTSNDIHISPSGCSRWVELDPLLHGLECTKTDCRHSTSWFWGSVIAGDWCGKGVGFIGELMRCVRRRDAAFVAKYRPKLLHLCSTQSNYLGNADQKKPITFNHALAISTTSRVYPQLGEALRLISVGIL
jgi:hypothetical protein